MNAVLHEMLAYPGALVRATREGWDRFFFRPAEPQALGLIRIVVGLLLLWNLANYTVDFADYFGANSWARPEILETMAEARAESEARQQPTLIGRPVEPREPWTWSIWLSLPQAWVPWVWALALIAALMFTTGTLTPVTAWISFAVVVSIARRNPFALYGFDTMISVWLLYLAVSCASGQAYSVDRLWKRWRSRPGTPAPPHATVSANLGLRLLQLHLCVVYAFAGLSKLQSPAWWGGAAVGQTIANAEFSPFNLSWLLAYPLAINLLTYGTLFIEILYPALIWVRILRPLLVVLAIGMHAGIALTMGLYEFGICMAAANMAFLLYRSPDESRLVSSSTISYNSQGRGELKGAESRAVPVDEPKARSLPGSKASRRRGAPASGRS